MSKTHPAHAFDIFFLLGVTRRQQGWHEDDPPRSVRQDCHTSKENLEKTKPDIAQSYVEADQ